MAYLPTLKAYPTRSNSIMESLPITESSPLECKNMAAPYSFVVDVSSSPCNFTFLERRPTSDLISIESEPNVSVAAKC
jgi:hypothetical protein